MSVFAHLIIILRKSVKPMSDSGRAINYSSRPAKGVERKLICELVSKFPKPNNISEYRYIGFGSFYFADFILFHNQLNIDKMISIEHSEQEERYKFNNPYKCIEILFCDAQDALSRCIDFSTDTKDFVWLDYDYELNRDIVSDLITASQKLSKGSFLFVSFNGSLKADLGERVQYLKEIFDDYIPSIQEKDIDKDSISKIFYQGINNAIQKSISARHVVDKISAKSIFFIKYRDGAPMITIGYYFGDEDFTIEWDRTKELPGVTFTGTPVVLKIPCFTKSEIRELNKRLPGSSAEEIKAELPYLELEDIRKYIGLYKYYPNYIDVTYYT